MNKTVAGILTLLSLADLLWAAITESSIRALIGVSLLFIITLDKKV